MEGQSVMSEKILQVIGQRSLSVCNGLLFCLHAESAASLEIRGQIRKPQP